MLATYFTVSLVEVDVCYCCKLLHYSLRGGIKGWVRRVSEREEGWEKGE